jgi:CRP-like cAMP-binding protein
VYKSFRSGDQVNAARRQVIDTTGKVFCIDTGYIGLYVGTGKGRRLLAMMKSGNIFPLYIKGNPIWQSEVHYIAMSKVSLYALPREKFLRDRENMDKSELQEKLAKSMQGNVWLMDRIINLLMHDVSRRLYLRLILLAEYLGVKHGDTVTLEIPLTHVDIAESIGTSRETVNRLVSSLQNDNVISIEKRIITIKSLSKLRALYDATSESEN